MKRIFANNFKTLISLLFMGATLLSPAATVSASSAYDNLVQPVSSLFVGNSASCQEDITNNWYNIILDDSVIIGGSPYDKSTVRYAIKEAVKSGVDWAIVQTKVGNTGYVNVFAKYPGLSTSTTFDEYAGNQMVFMSNVVMLQIAYLDLGAPYGCQYYVEFNGSIATREIIFNQTSGTRQPYYVNTSVTYPSGYAGVVFETNPASMDTDGDGLNDYIESEQFEDYDDTFCATSVTPKVCASPDPLKKDIYVEVDWMENGTTSYKPTSTQLDLVKDAFEDKGINLHFDTGQYGGGNELPVISPLKFVPDVSDTDFFNLKNGDLTYSPNFAEERRGIWRYMITGNQYDDGDDYTTSGVAYPGDDDAFISLGQIVSDHPSTADVAVAGTIMHELGHNLCLSKSAYSGQDASCLSSLIDTSAPLDYNSVMNYNKQFSMVNYSDGVNVLDDHDDWSAILVGMDDFVVHGEDPTEGLFRRGGPVFDKQPQI